MNQLDLWLSLAADELGVDPAEVDVPLVLALARQIAHRTVRPGAPVTAYLLGLAVGRGADPAEAAARLATLLDRWSPPEPVEPT